VALRLAGLLVLNTTVAIIIGLTVANVIKPGARHALDVPKPTEVAADQVDPIDLLVQNVPRVSWGRWVIGRTSSGSS